MVQYIDFQTESDDIKEHFKHIITVLKLISDAISNFRAYIISGERNNDLMVFHGGVFQYFMIIQFLKLLDENTSGTKGIASIYKINSLLKQKHPLFISVFDANSTTISEIKANPFFQTLVLLRNKCYAHSDNHDINPAMTFKIISEEEFNIFLDLFKKSIEIFRNCYGIYDRHYDDFSNYYNSNRTTKYLEKVEQYKNEHFNGLKGKRK